MFRFTPVNLSMSPYALFVKDVRRKTTSNMKLNMRQIKQKYRSLTKKERDVFVRRARSLRNPNLDTFNQFQKRHARNFTHMPMNARSRVVGILYRQYKAGKPLNFAVAEKDAKRAALRAKRQAAAKAKTAQTKVKKTQVKAKGKLIKAKAKAVKAKAKAVKALKAKKPAVGKRLKATKAAVGKKLKATRAAVGKKLKAKKPVVGKKLKAKKPATSKKLRVKKPVVGKKKANKVRKSRKVKRSKKSKK